MILENTAASNPIEEIKDRLAKYPGVRYDADDFQITIHRSDSDGFAVSLYVHKTGFTVAFDDGWHEEFVPRLRPSNASPSAFLRPAGSESSTVARRRIAGPSRASRMASGERTVRWACSCFRSGDSGTWSTVRTR